MTNWYLDPEYGDDTYGDGSLANPWKTITLGSTAARIAPGDEIRIKKSPPATSAGINATFTYGAYGATLASALTQEIDDCDAAWTYSTYITGSNDTLYKHQGTGSVKLVVGTAFVTGLMAYKNIEVGGGAQDFSAYSRICFQLQTSVDIAANTLRLDLCSNNDGTGAVDSYTIPFILQGGTGCGFHFIEYNKGSALSSSVRSVALTALLDPGVPTIWLDNIEATNDFNQCALISNSINGPWFALLSVNGTFIGFGQSQKDIAIHFDWPGASGSQELFYRKPYSILQQRAGPVGNGETINSMTEAGTTAARIRWRGGWDFEQDAQTDETWFDGMNLAGRGIYFNSASYQDIERINFSRCQTAYYAWIAYYCHYRDIKAAGCMAFITNNGSYIDADWLHGSLEFTGGYALNTGILVFPTGTSTYWNLRCDADMYFATSYTDAAILIQGSGNRLTGTIRVFNCYTASAVMFTGNGNYVKRVEYDDCGNNGTALAFEGLASGNVIDELYCSSTTYFTSTDGAVGKNRIGIATTDETGVAVISHLENAIDSMICYDIYKTANHWLSENRYGIICDQVTGGQTEAWAHGGAGTCLYMRPSTDATFSRWPLRYKLYIPVEANKWYQIHFWAKKTTGTARLFVTYSGCGITPVAPGEYHEGEEIPLTTSWTEWESASFYPLYDGFMEFNFDAFFGAYDNALGIDDIHLAPDTAIGIQVSETINFTEVFTPEQMPQRVVERVNFAESITVAIA